MDEGTESDICNIVNGEKVKLKLGYTVVKCRGQKAIESKLSLEDAIQSEENFFKNHDVLGVLYQEKKTGIQNLSHQLTKQLVEQIKVLKTKSRNWCKQHSVDTLVIRFYGIMVH